MIVDKFLQVNPNFYSGDVNPNLSSGDIKLSDSLIFLNELSPWDITPGHKILDSISEFKNSDIGVSCFNKCLKGPILPPYDNLTFVTRIDRTSKIIIWLFKDKNSESKYSHDGL